MLLATIVIDYSLSDGNNFFDPQTTDGQAARAAVEAAARVFTDALGDSLDEINVGGGGFSWAPRIQDPEDRFSPTLSLQTNMIIPKDQVIVFVGAGNGSLGNGSPGAIAWSSSLGTPETVARLNALFSRGEGNGMRMDVENRPADQMTAFDFAPWGGSLSFGFGSSWHFDHTTPPAADKHDLYTVALHELAHVLGFGTAHSFRNLIDGTGFNGPHAAAAYDGEGNPPVDGDHWPTDTSDGGQETTMTPSIGRGERKPFTELDFAALFDLGWESNVPAPDLTATKTNNVAGRTTFGNSWTWTTAIANTGDLAATFAAGQSIFSDNLPNANVSFSTPTVGNQTGISGSGAIVCTVTASDLTCVASGSDVTIAAGTGGFQVHVLATPAAAGTFVNPRTGGTCAVDPAGNVTERDERNNACSNTVTVDPPQPMPDLVVAFAGAGLSTMFVPGERITNLQATVRNIGNAPANGPAVIDVVLSPDNQIGNADDIAIATTQQTLNLPPAPDPRSARTYSLKGQIPANIPAGTYIVGVRADSRNTLGEGNEANNTAMLAGTIDVVTQVGQVGERYIKSLSLLIDNVLTRFSAKGVGTYDIQLGGSFSMDATGTDARSKLQITPAKGQTVVMNEFTAADPLGELSAAGVEVRGDFDFQQGVGKITVGNVSGPAMMHIGRNAMIASTQFIAGSVRDLNIRSEIGMLSIAVEQWMDTDLIEDVIEATGFGRDPRSRGPFEARLVTTV